MSQDIEFYRQMSLIRHVESTLLDLFSQGLLNGTVHTSIGQEACAVGVVSSINRDIDIIFSNHRCHGHFLAYCEDFKSLIAEIMGKTTGVCGGIGGSQHIQFRNFYSNGILGSGMPVITGMAMAEKQKKSGAIALSFVGDGTFGEGILYESLNIASLWELPLLIVFEHNQYAQSAHYKMQHAGNLNTRAETFGIPVTIVNGMDVNSVFEASSEIVSQIRENSRPQMLLLNTYRFSPHSKGDDTRDVEEIEEYRKKDPLLVLEKSIGNEKTTEINDRIKSLIYDVVEELSRE